MKKVDKGIKYYGFLLQKQKMISFGDSHNVGRRLLQSSITNSSNNLNECEHIIAIYQPNNSYMYSAIGCWEFGRNFTDVDFSMDDVSGDYLYYTKYPGSDNQNDPHTTALEKITRSSLILSGEADLSDIKLSFLGFNGTNSSDSCTLTLKDYTARLVPPPQDTSSNFLFWMILIILIIAAIVGGYYLYKYYNKRNKLGPGYGGFYKTQPATSDNDLDDFKL